MARGSSEVLVEVVDLVDVVWSSRFAKFAKDVSCGVESWKKFDFKSEEVSFGEEELVEFDIVGKERDGKRNGRRGEDE